jgi:hypothetical protein
MKQIDKERKLIDTCIRKQLTMCRSGKPVDNTFNPPYIALPRSLVDENGYPHKADKSGPTNFFKNRYSSADVVVCEFP